MISLSRGPLSAHGKSRPKRSGYDHVKIEIVEYTAHYLAARSGTGQANRVQPIDRDPTVRLMSCKWIDYYDGHPSNMIELNAPMNYTTAEAMREVFLFENHIVSTDKSFKRLLESDTAKINGLLLPTERRFTKGDGWNGLLDKAGWKGVVLGTRSHLFHEHHAAQQWRDLVFCNGERISYGGMGCELSHVASARYIIWRLDRL